MTGQVFQGVQMIQLTHAKTPGGPLAVNLNFLTALWPAGDPVTGGAWVRIVGVPAAVLVEESYRAIQSIIQNVNDRAGR